MSENIFETEWRECLEAHYMHVIRTRDKVTEPSLTHVMHQAGFNASELAELRVRATMHVDDSGADFVPDMDVLEAVEEARIIAVGAADLPPQPVATETVIEPEAEINTEALIEELEDEAAEAEAMAEAPPPDAPDEDAPQQLSLF